MKTSQQPLRREALYGKGKFWMWTMSEKHQRMKDPRLFYCFVNLQGPDRVPRFFIVSSATVARYVKWQHENWLRTRKRKVKSTTMRRFRIPVEDPSQYENNWAVLGKRRTARK